MPVFDFNHTPETEDTKGAECTYSIFYSDAPQAAPEQPILVLDTKGQQWEHHTCGLFTNPVRGTAFEFKDGGETVSGNILKIDARFVSLIRWLGENHINVRLSGGQRRLFRLPHP